MRFTTTPTAALAAAAKFAAKALDAFKAGDAQQATFWNARAADAERVADHLQRYGRFPA